MDQWADFCARPVVADEAKVVTIWHGA